MKIFKFNLGSEVKDKITGFKGVIRVRSEYLTGCNVYGVQPQKLTKDGEIGAWKYFDEDLLVLVKKDKIVINTEDKVVTIKKSTNKPKVEIVRKRKTGGPHSANEQAPSR